MKKKRLISIILIGGTILSLMQPISAFASVTTTNTIQETTDMGWIKDGDNWIYNYSNGEKCTGWLNDCGFWYYFDKCGHMVQNEMRKIDGNIYSFDSNGHMQVSMSKKLIYTENKFNHTGSTDGSGLLCATTFVNIAIDSNGVCNLTSNYYDDINIVLCYQHSHKDGNGRIHTQLFDKNGDEVFGWYSEPMYTWNADSENYSTTYRWTYYDENGLEVRNASKVIDGKTYSFDNLGYLI